MYNELDFISTNTIVNGEVSNLRSLELYLSEFIYNISSAKYNVFKASRQIGLSSMLKSYAACQLLSGKDVIFVSPATQINMNFKNDVLKIIENYYRQFGLNELFGVKDYKNKLRVNERHLYLVCRDTSLVGYRIDNGVMILDCANNIRGLEKILDITYRNHHQYDKIILGGNNSRDKITHFDEIYESENSPDWWNKFELHYSLCSRVKNYEDNLRAILGDRFDIEYGLK